MKRRNKWIFYIKGTKQLAFVLMIIFLFFSGSVLWAEMKYGQVQMYGLCEQENERLNITFAKEISKCIDVAKNLTITNISILPENYTPEQFERYYLESKQISAIVRVSEPITSVVLKYGDKYIVQGPEDGRSNTILSEATFWYQYADNVQLFWFDDEPKYLYMKYVPINVTTGAEEVLIKISLGRLSEKCVQNVNDNLYSYIVLEDGTIVVASSGSEIGKNIEEIYQNSRKWSLKKANTEDSLVAISAVSTDLYKEYILNAVLLGGIFCVFFLILMALLIYTYYMFLVKPIGNILKYIQLRKEEDEYDKDAVNYINKYIVMLHGENRRLDKEVQNVVSELKKRQIISCQRQIKSHFVSNTLSAISWMAVDKYNRIDNPISNALTALADIYRSAMALDEIFVTVEQEQEDAERYIEIMKLRYGACFDVIWEIEEELKQEMILKTSIQPLVENCISHAFVSMACSKEIYISIRSRGENVLVAVKDNGIGIPPDKLQKLRSVINDVDSSGRKCVGLKNINQRIKILYGEEYGLRIESVQGSYTVCSFEYPKEVG